MLQYKVDETPVTVITGLELVQGKSHYKLQQHSYVGKEPEPLSVYESIAMICHKLGITPHLSLNRCDDEVGGTTHIQRSFMLRSSFMNALIGTQASEQPTDVAGHEGHSSTLYEVNVHMGMYKHPQTGKILLGKVEGRDHSFRPTCGALAAILGHFEKGSEPDVYTHKDPNGEDVKVYVATPDGNDFNFIGKLYHDLVRYKSDVVTAIDAAGEDPDERLSAGMDIIVQKNLETQVQRQIEILQSQKHHAEKLLVVGTTSLNKYRYADTLLLGNLHLIEDGKVIDLSKQEF